MNRIWFPVVEMNLQALASAMACSTLAQCCQECSDITTNYNILYVF